MSNRTKLAALGFLLLALTGVTTWYALRGSATIAESTASSGIGDRLGVANQAVAPPAAWDTQETPAPPTQNEAASSTTARSPLSATPAATEARTTAKHKRRPAEAALPKEEAALPKEEPPPPTAPPAASVAPTPVGMLVVRHHNAVGTSLRLVKVTYLPDGNVAFTEEGDKLSQSRDFEAFSRRPSPGEHAVSVIAEFQGNGRGVFSYFDSYRYKAQSSRRFDVRE